MKQPKLQNEQYSNQRMKPHATAGKDSQNRISRVIGSDPAAKGIKTHSKPVKLNVGSVNDARRHQR